MSEWKKVAKVPESITLALLECVIMPNGEVITKGKTLGMFMEFKGHLFNATEKGRG